MMHCYSKPEPRIDPEAEAYDGYLDECYAQNEPALSLTAWRDERERARRDAEEERAADLWEERFA